MLIITQRELYHTIFGVPKINNCDWGGGERIMEDAIEVMPSNLPLTYVGGLKIKINNIMIFIKSSIITLL